MLGVDNGKLQMTSSFFLGYFALWRSWFSLHLLWSCCFNLDIQWSIVVGGKDDEKDMMMVEDKEERKIIQQDETSQLYTQTKVWLMRITAIGSSGNQARLVAKQSQILISITHPLSNLCILWKWSIMSTVKILYLSYCTTICSQIWSASPDSSTWWICHLLYDLPSS